MHKQTEIEILTQEIKKLNATFKWHNSFIRGMLNGFGTAVGAGLLVWLVAVALEQLTGLPIFGQLFAFLAESVSGVQ